MTNLELHPLFVEEPLAGQAAFFQSQADSRWCICGNRAGKTRALLREVAWWFTGLHPYRDVPDVTDGWVVTLDRDFAASTLLPILLEFIPPDFVQKIEKGDVVRVHGKSGSKLTFRTYGQGWQKFQGAKIHYAAFDEECPEDVYDEVCVRLIDYCGPHWVAMTPLSGKTWVYTRIVSQKHDPKDLEIFSWSTLDNKHVDPGRVQKTFGRMDPKVRDARLNGSFVDLEGLIWPNFDERIHMVDEFDLPQHWKLWVGMDGGIRHPFAFVGGATDERGGIVLWKSWKASGALISQCAKRILETFKEYAPWAVDAKSEDTFKRALRGETDHIDSDRPTIRARFTIDPSAQQTREEFRPYGIFPTNANRDMLGGIGRVGELFGAVVDGKPGLTIMRGRNGDLLDELRLYSWAKKGMKSRVVGPQRPQNENDDCCDGLRYLAMECPMPSAAPEPEVVPGSFNWYMQQKAAAKVYASRAGVRESVSRIESRLIRLGRAW